MCATTKIGISAILFGPYVIARPLPVSAATTSKLDVIHATGSMQTVDVPTNYTRASIAAVSHARRISVVKS